ncbi:MAG: DUF2851 family protein, partial [Deltaproteobacteria bacterium]|nr:DUF2851 family protein [Deltaproteobacteria bacterium]
EDIEQVLFEKVFYYLGYRPQAEIFEKLARRHPLREMYLLLEKKCSRAREEVLARWFGAAGILADTGRPPVDQGAENELLVLRHIWNDLGLQSLSDTVARRSSRPWNTPERRLAGFFNHLHILAPGGYLKGWLAFLRRLDGLRNQPDFRKAALRELEGLFDTPPGDPWKSRYNYHSASARSARLIGMDRIIMLMANAVLPFFLAYARSRKDREFEKLLYRLYLVLPPEASNNRTRFMENRLLCFASQKPSLRSQQGLLQIHQDFCISYHEGCHQCTLPDLL